ncbi:MAG: globin domain-containing protein [Myxococcota bacterium]
MNVELLRSSFALVVEREPELTRRFYEIFFADYPQVRSLFGRRSERAQQEMLRDALAAVIEHLEDGEWLTDTLGELGRKHTGYGVTTPMYDWVGASLLKTLAEVAGDAWSDELAAAWAEAYGVIASAMQAGAKAPAA